MSVSRSLRWGMGAALLAFLAPAMASAQAVTPMKPIVNDARSSLKAGFRNPGVAASNMELVANLPSPVGFTNPDYKEGEILPPPTPGAPPSRNTGPTGGVFTNSDLAFFKNRVVMGNYHGFNVYDVASGDKLKLLASVVCPGGQGDVSVRGNLLFMSVEQTRGRLDCGPGGVEGDVSKDRFRGIRIFDISDLKNIHQVAAVQTCRGSHTHTLVPDPKDAGSIYVYNQGTNAPRPGEELAGCSNKQPDEDPNTSLFSIDIIKVPLANPSQARIISSPRIFADPTTGALNGLFKGGKQGEAGQTARVTSACHDITVYPEMGLAAGACQGNGILLDISDPAAPKRLDAQADANFAYWHAAVFSNDASKLLFTDEWGGGSQPRCRMEDPANWGGDIIYDIVNRKLSPRSIYKLPAAQSDKENCVAHNANLIPVPGRDVVVQAWYQGGVSVFDISDSAHPFEIASFDRGPIDPNQMFSGGFWSAYWHNGRIWGSEMARGLDVMKLKPSQFLTANEIAAAELVQMDEYNPQTQVKFVWPAKAVVGRAYLDQLTRDKAVTAARAAEITKALGAQGSAASVALAAQLDKDVGQAQGRNAERLSGIARVLRAKA